MIVYGYSAVKSEKTIFKKTKGMDYIIHGLFVDDMIIMMHISSCDELKQEFMYSKDFQITGGGLIKTFLEVEQSRKTINLHLDCYTHQVLVDYKDPRRCQHSLSLESGGCTCVAGSAQAKVQSVFCSKASIRSNMLEHGCGSMLHIQYPSWLDSVICRRSAMGGAAPSHGIS
jgi:hypothetical protein